MMRHAMYLRFAILSLVSAALMSLTTLSRADVVPVGDVFPNNISDAGGDVGGDLIIGDTDVGGLFMDIAPPLSGTLEPLQSTNGIIGNEINAIGAAVFDDLGVSWRVEDTLVVGLEGQGFLDVFQSASILVGYDPNTGDIDDGIVILGDELTGQGIMTLNDRGTRLATSELTVGNFGVGQLDLINGGSVLSEDSFIGRDSQSNGHVNVTGLGSRWDSRGVLRVGNDLSGIGVLRIEDRGLVQSGEDGSVIVGIRGFIELSNGTLRQIGITPITTGGVIKGDGTIQGELIIAPTGELRNAAAQVVDGPITTQQRERLVVTGPVLNNGTIESLGGEMEFLAPVVNNLEFVARDAVIRVPNTLAPPGLQNNGDLVLGGNTTFHGGIDNAPGAELTVLLGSEATVVGDLVFSAASFMALGIGPSAGTLDVIGTADITDAFLTLDYSAGLGSQPGDTYTVFNATQGVLGTFANTQAVADGRLWDINYNGTEVFVTATLAAAVPFGADFNGDGIVDSIDLSIWDANYGLTGPPGSLGDVGDADGDGDVDGMDFLEIQMDFGMAPSFPIVAVPEPATLALVLSALAFTRRRRVG